MYSKIAGHKSIRKGQSFFYTVVSPYQWGYVLRSPVDAWNYIYWAINIHTHTHVCAKYICLIFIKHIYTHTCMIFLIHIYLLQTLIYKLGTVRDQQLTTNKIEQL